MNYLIHSLPKMSGKWEDIFSPGFYTIKAEQKETNGQKVYGAIDFFELDEETKKMKIRAQTYATLIPEPRSISGWTVSITADQCAKPQDLRVKRASPYADDDCAWWGCIDG